MTLFILRDVKKNILLKLLAMSARLMQFKYLPTVNKRKDLKLKVTLLSILKALVY